MTPLDLKHEPTEQQGRALFPREISRFFTDTPGHTLLVNGAPGTGKTLFTISGLDVLEHDGDVLYVSTRVDQDTVYEMYFEDHSSLNKSHILDLSQDPFELPLDVDVPFDKLDFDSLLNWIQQIKGASNWLTIAFDSWELIYEYVSSRSDDPPDIETVTNQLVALARQENIRMLLVSETSDSSPLEYIVDGVVSLQVAEDERGRTRRHLRLEKLRGVRIGNRLQPITLADGQFQSISPVELSTVRTGTSDGTWEPRANSRAKFSTGVSDLDPILSGGYNRGSVVYLDLGTDLSRDSWSVLTLPTIRNFLANEMGVAIIPPDEGSPGLLHSDLNAVLTSQVFKTYCHIFETYVSSSRSTRSSENADYFATAAKLSQPVHSSDPNASTEAESELTSPVDGGQLDYKRYIEYVEQLREQSNGPMLHVISMETARTTFEAQLGDFANYVALHNDLSILVTKPGSELQPPPDRVADMHFRLERLGNATILYGENPLTPMLGIGIDKSQAISEITLTEMV